MGKTSSFSVVLNKDFQTQNFGRGSFLCRLWYDETHEKPRPMGEVVAKPPERAKWSRGR